jgi:hypothetical protein
MTTRLHPSKADASKHYYGILLTWNKGTPKEISAAYNHKGKRFAEHTQHSSHASSTPASINVDKLKFDLKGTG